MASTPVIELRRKSDAAAANLSKQLQGMEPLLDKSDAAGEWTTRQVLCHLLGDPDSTPVAMLKSFTSSNLPVIELKPGHAAVTPERQKMTLAQLQGALAAQHRDIFGYLPPTRAAACSSLRSGPGAVVPCRIDTSSLFGVMFGVLGPVRQRRCTTQ